MRLISRRIGPIIFALSWIVRVALVLVMGSYRAPVIAVEAVQIAGSLAAGLGFSNPYNCVTGATAHMAPVYPWLVSLLYRTFPPGDTRQLARFILSATVVSLAYALLPWLAARLRLDPSVGMLAGLAGAAFPLFFWEEVISEWEAPLSALLLLVALGLFADLFGQVRARQAVLAGTAWGLALLAAPTLLPVFAALLVVLLWREKRRLPSLRLPLAALLAPVVLIILPWTIRNYQVFHEFILIRGNAGLQLHLSFNPQAPVTFEEGAASGAFADHPFTNLRVCMEVARSGEVAMNRRYQQQAIEWIRDNPGRSARLVAERFVAFWRMAVPSRAKTVVSELLTLFGLLGLGLCVSRLAFAAPLLGSAFLMYPLAYYVNFFEVRYRYPLHPLVLLLACLFLSEMARILRRNPSTANVPSGQG